MSNVPLLYTVGYGIWKPAARMTGLINSLKQARVKLLIDARHSPCAAATSADSLYGPKDWNLQVAAGISELLAREGIQYLWMLELGNPQKNDKSMAVLRSQLADDQHEWPVHRGLALLAARVRDRRHPCCILCACQDYATCHRRLVAEALRTSHFQGKLTIANLGAHSIDPC